MSHNDSQMRTAAPPLLPIFRSQLQGELLALVLLGQDQVTVSDLARRLDAPFATVAREVNRLERAGLLRSRRVGRARQIAVDDDNPAVRPLRELVMIAFGPRQVIADEFGGLAGLSELLIFGSWASRYSGVEGTPPGDVDVLVVGDPNRDEVYDAARRAEARLSREVNPTVVSSQRWAEAAEPFLIEIRSRPTVPLPRRTGAT